MKFQIRRTVEEHLRKELKLNKQGVKVLSLFLSTEWQTIGAMMHKVTLSMENSPHGLKKYIMN